MRDRSLRSAATDGDWLELGGRFGRVHPLFYEAVRRQVEAMIPMLEPGRAYTTRELCGEAFWHLLIGPLERRQAGMCLRDLVDRGLDALVPVTPKGKYPRKYRLK